MIAGKKLAIVPVLRAGIGMSDGLLDLVPSARVGHIGVYRAEDHRPVEYLVRLPPDLEERVFILCDPMVATGYSAVHAVDVMKRRKVPGENIMFVALVAAPEGVKVFSGRASGREAVCGVARFASERARVYRAGSRRRRRPAVRHEELNAFWNAASARELLDRAAGKSPALDASRPFGPRFSRRPATAGFGRHDKILASAYRLHGAQPAGACGLRPAPAAFHHRRVPPHRRTGAKPEDA